MLSGDLGTSNSCFQVSGWFQRHSRSDRPGCCLRRKYSIAAAAVADCSLEDACAVLGRTGHAVAAILLCV